MSNDAALERIIPPCIQMVMMMVMVMVMVMMMVMVMVMVTIIQTRRIPHHLIRSKFDVGQSTPSHGPRVDSRTREKKNTLTALEHMALEHIGMHQDVNDAALERKRSVMRLWIIQTSIIPFRDDDGDDDHHPDASIIIQI